MAVKRNLMQAPGNTGQEIKNLAEQGGLTNTTPRDRFFFINASTNDKDLIATLVYVLDRLNNRVSELEEKLKNR